MSLYAEKPLTSRDIQHHDSFREKPIGLIARLLAP
jgi:hypothetical protein